MDFQTIFWSYVFILRKLFDKMSQEIDRNFEFMVNPSSVLLLPTDIRIRGNFEVHKFFFVFLNVDFFPNPEFLLYI
ncbi:hypothetical protein L9F63_024009, partial [Diploptera punctata]